MSSASHSCAELSKPVRARVLFLSALSLPPLTQGIYLKIWGLHSISIYIYIFFFYLFISRERERDIYIYMYVL